MSNSTKDLSSRDPSQIFQASFNESDKSLSTTSFITGKVGRKITQTTTTTTVANDSILFQYIEGSTLLYELKVVYTDSTKTTMLSVERIS